MAEEMAPEQSSVRNLLGSMDEEILEIAKQVYQREYETALSVHPQHQEQFLAELHEDLSQCLARAGL